MFFHPVKTTSLGIGCEMFSPNSRATRCGWVCQRCCIQPQALQDGSSQPLWLIWFAQILFPNTCLTVSLPQCLLLHFGLCSALSSTWLQCSAGTDSLMAPNAAHRAQGTLGHFDLLLASGICVPS